MGTYCAIHIKTQDEQRLLSEFERYLAENHAGHVVQRRTTQTMGDLYGKEFLNSMKPPTKLAVFSDHPGWYTVHCNCFNNLRDLELKFSKDLETEVITVIAQTTSSAYYFSVSRCGQHLRALQCGDGEFSLKEGDLLPFEKEPVGQNVSDIEDEPWYVFEEESVKEYCRHFGLTIWPDTSSQRCTVIQTLPARLPASSD